MPTHDREPLPNGTKFLRGRALFGWSHRSGWNERGSGNRVGSSWSMTEVMPTGV